MICWEMIFYIPILESGFKRLILRSSMLFIRISRLHSKFDNIQPKMALEQKFKYVTGRVLYKKIT